MTAEEMRQRCILLVCEYCRQGMPVVQGKGDERTFWHHPQTEEEVARRTMSTDKPRCNASAIRALGELIGIEGGKK